jgi:Ca2+-binding EF-hand superfamily protein
MFELLDSNGDGAIDCNEFSVWIQSLKIIDLNVSDEFIVEVFDTFDDDGSGELNFDELLRGLFPDTFQSVLQKANNKSTRTPDASPKASPKGSQKPSVGA